MAHVGILFYYLYGGNAMAYMSEEGYKKLMGELRVLETVDRPEISRQIAEARDKGDLSENAEYDAAKEAQGMLEMRINKLKTIIADAKIIDESKLKTDTVQILSKVELNDVKNGKKMVYTIVPESEANIREGKISVNTPIAQGLLGKKVGDIAEIKVPQGMITLEIVNISI
jgi:transcription elongation factor GreA